MLPCTVCIALCDLLPFIITHTMPHCSYHGTCCMTCLLVCMMPPSFCVHSFHTILCVLCCPCFVASPLFCTWYCATFSSLTPCHLVFVPCYFLGGRVPCSVIGTSHPFIVAWCSVFCPFFHCVTFNDTFSSCHRILCSYSFPVSLYVLLFCIALVSLQYIWSRLYHF